MPNKIFKQLASLGDPHSDANARLYFMNMLNNAGVNDKPIIFDNYYNASKACPSLAKICDALSPKQVQQLIDRIENIR